MFFCVSPSSFHCLYISSNIEQKEKCKSYSCHLSNLGMELMTLIHAFSATLSFMLVSCASDQLILQKAAQQFVVSNNSAVQQQRPITLTLLPRKLKLEKVADVKSSTDKDIMLQKKLLESSSVKKENVVRKATAIKGTWREWVERGPTKSEYFTMDYSRVRRRRPIHNKQITFLP